MKNAKRIDQMYSLQKTFILVYTTSLGFAYGVDSSVTNSDTPDPSEENAIGPYAGDVENSLNWIIAACTLLLVYYLYVIIGWYHEKNIRSEKLFDKKQDGGEAILYSCCLLLMILIILC